MLINNSSFLIGAGFSFPAKIPLGNRILEETLNFLKNDPLLHDYDLSNYNRYLSELTGYIPSKTQERLEPFFSAINAIRDFRTLNAIPRRDEACDEILNTLHKAYALLLEKLSYEAVNNPLIAGVYHNFFTLLGENCSIVSLNNDSILERIFWQRSPNEKYKPVVGWDTPLYKIHGTANMWNNKAKNQAYSNQEKLRYYNETGEDDYIRVQWEECIGKKLFTQGLFKSEMALIVAQPTLMKNLSSVYYKQNILDASEKMGRSKNWYIIGCSLNEYDHHLAGLLLSARSWGNLENIYIVDPNFDEIKSKLLRIINFPPDKIFNSSNNLECWLTKSNKSEHFVKKICRLLCRSIFK